jgi:hypothetical protein
MSRHFGISVSIVKEILSRELRLNKYTRKWVPYELSGDQREFRADESGMLLDILQFYAEHQFEGIATGGESWFRHSTYADSMFAP